MKKSFKTSGQDLSNRLNKPCRRGAERQCIKTKQ